MLCSRNSGDVFKCGFGTFNTHISNCFGNESQLSWLVDRSTHLTSVITIRRHGLVSCKEGRKTLIVHLLLVVFLTIDTFSHLIASNVKQLWQNRCHALFSAEIVQRQDVMYLLGIGCRERGDRYSLRGGCWHLNLTKPLLRHSVSGWIFRQGNRCFLVAQRETECVRS